MAKGMACLARLEVNIQHLASSLYLLIILRIFVQPNLSAIHLEIRKTRQSWGGCSNNKFQYILISGIYLIILPYLPFFFVFLVCNEIQFPDAYDPFL